MKEYKHYLTTPIYYINSRPHIGHTYTTVMCDIIKRYYNLFGEATYLLTGTDEHGEKIAQAAQACNMEVHAFTDQNSKSFRDMWDLLDIKYDDFIRTTEPRHKKIVQSILQKLYETGDIYFDSYEGKYCVGCERFITDSELVNGKCPDHDKEPKLVKESNYFFKTRKYVPEFKKLVEQNPDLIRPIKYRNEVLGYLNDNSGILDSDLCISRPKSRVSWGIDLPFDTNYVTYVWFDALVNYISAIGYPDGDGFKNKWAVSEHFIAKDILRTHSVYWGPMLLSMGLPLFKNLNVHGYWNMSGLKMSKSLGNVVEPGVFKQKYGDENLRFFFSREMHWGDDADFTIERFIGRYNTDLANNYGNLISRTFGMIEKYFASDSELMCDHLPKEHALKNLINESLESYKHDFRNYEFYKTLDKLWLTLDETNKYIADSKPWDIAKTGNKDELLKVLLPVLEVLRIATFMIYPIMPSKSEAVLKELGFNDLANYKTNEFLKWGYSKKFNAKYANKMFFARMELAIEETK